jgi:hypothetical protein
MIELIYSIGIIRNMPPRQTFL